MDRTVVMRDAGPADIAGMLAVYSSCIVADPGYLPFLAAGDETAVLAWFGLKPLVACLVAERVGVIVGVAGLRDAELEIRDTRYDNHAGTLRPIQTARRLPPEPAERASQARAGEGPPR